MIADFCIGLNGGNPVAHLLLTLRPATVLGFGPKERVWNRRALLEEWRASWADRAKEHLARAGHRVRIDHRTLEAQQNLLAPARRIGVARCRQSAHALPSHLAERVLEQQRVADANGAAILADPTLLLRALTHQHPIFTLRDLERFLRSRTHGEAQSEAAYARVIDSGELVALSSALAGNFTSRDMLEAERSLMRRVASISGRRHSAVAQALLASAAAPISLSEEQRWAFDYLVGEGHVKAIALASGPEQAMLLAALHRTWSSAGLAVLGAAPTQRAARDLQSASGIASTTVAKREEDWSRGVDLPARDSILVVGGADTLALKQLERLVAVADAARAKVVLLGDEARLRAMKVEVPFASVLRQIGSPAASDAH
jgi:ATP-dependent exoDNAse (exonuclease V) alpha subunit